MDILSLGPKNSVLENFDDKDILVELDGPLNFCKEQGINDDIITDINIKTLTYIKKCKKQKYSRNVQLTCHYLKDNDLVAVPFNKGTDICVMKVNVYQEKLMNILKSSQFQKLVPKRKNEKHPVVKEEERVIALLKHLRDQDKISQKLHEEVKLIGSQPSRLYGLAKVHKKGVPMRPVLSMLGSPYHEIALKVTQRLSVVSECKNQLLYSRNFRVFTYCYVG